MAAVEAESKTLDQVKEYYGKVLSDSSDLKTGACCSIEAIPLYQQEVLREIDDEILTRFYGCGSPIPVGLKNRTVLDLGCGTGRDVYMVSKLVGPDGFVIGVDMTDEQLEVARKHVNTQTERFGFKVPNVEFRKGYIEDLASAGIADNSVDVVISNCVINLSPDKPKVLSEIMRVLKPGGELYFSDVFADRRIPREVAEDPIVYGECLGGAMYVEDFRRVMRDLGVLDYRMVSRRPVAVTDPALEKITGNIKFESINIRAFKLDNLEDLCEDYGQYAIYKGSIPESPHQFLLDDHHLFEKGKPMLVCGNTAAMVENTHYAEHFQVFGDRSVHYGEFPCGTPVQGTGASSNIAGACC